MASSVQSFDFVVVGGGLAGVAAAVAAARRGVRVALVNDRPVLGGNSSSEIRVCPGGADHGKRPAARETGVMEEIRLEDRFRNHAPHRNGHMNWIWDQVLLDLVRAEPNVTLCLNTLVTGAVMKDERTIAAVEGEELGSERVHRLEAGLFADCSGDGRMAASAGAEFRMGREARSEFDEDRAPERADRKTLGSSLLFHARDLGRPVDFTAPDWAYPFPMGRGEPNRWFDSDHAAGYWWIEWGGGLDTIDDNAHICDELTKHLFGVWAYVKRTQSWARSLALDWVGRVPGKRESRRFVGDVILTQRDLEEARPRDDQVAYGGWPIDLHPPKGIMDPGEPAEMHRLESIYPIPLGALYSANIANLFFAGRNISASHVAFGSTRLMATAAVMGQAVGTAAAVGVRRGLTPKELGSDRVEEIQQALLADDCYLIDVSNRNSDDLARTAQVTASSEAPGEEAAKVTDGVARPVGDELHRWSSADGAALPQWLELDLGAVKKLREIRIAFDTNLDEPVDFGAPPECVKDYSIEVATDGKWREIVREKANHHRRRAHSLGDVASRRLRIVCRETWGADRARVYEVRLEA
jgi:hypothetical protein